MKKLIMVTFLVIVLCALLQMPLLAVENADVIVAKDGSGDFTTIQEAINSIPSNNSSLKTILIKNGVYNEKIRFDTNFIALVGEDRDSTRIEYFEPYVWDSVYVYAGQAVVNVHANDITLANLTVENTQLDVGVHAFAIYGTDCTRIIIINCNILSNGGDTLSLWNGSSGMYYHNTLNLRGAVDFICPRGWCYAENLDLYCTRYTTPLWHDGSKDEDQKFVVKNATMDGATSFVIGRNHHDGAFYLMNMEYSIRMLDEPFTLPESADGPYVWGERYYYNNCIRPAGNYDWFKNNMITAKGSPMPEEVTPAWTFANKWDPEATLPSVLPFAFLPKPDNNQIRVDLEPVLTWVPGRNVQTHKVYFGASNPPEHVADIAERSYTPGKLEPNTTYYWQVDEVNDGEIIEGPVWQFLTRTDQLPQKAVNVYPPDLAEEVPGPIERILWKADSLTVDLQHLYFGTHPDSLELISTYSVPGYYPGPLVMGETYYWRVDLENAVGITQGDLWQFTMEIPIYLKADYLQTEDSDGIVSIEAEAFTDSANIGDHAWHLITDPTGYSGTGAMQILPDDGDFCNSFYSDRCSVLNYAVNFIKTGTHYIWIRAYSKDGNDNVFHVGINGIEDRAGARIGNFAGTGQWEWLNGAATSAQEIRTFEVEAVGIQQVNLWYGRDGAIADKIVLTTNPDYVPTGMGPEWTKTAIETTGKTHVPVDFELRQNYPNPFNPETTFGYSVPEASHVSLMVYDILGRKVATLVNERKEMGAYSIQWNAKSENMNDLASGVYYARLIAGDFSKSVKILYLK